MNARLLPLLLLSLAALSACGDDEKPRVAGGLGGEGGGTAGAGGDGGTGGGDPACEADELLHEGVCRDACNPETQERPDGSDCPGGTACAELGIDENGSPYGACLPENGGGTRGDRCDSQHPCELDHACEEGRCVPRCDPGQETCGEGLRCGEMGVCEPSTCTSDEGCADDQVCGTVVRDDGIVDTACVFQVGEGDAGSPCTGNGECASGRCIAELGICHGVCEDSSDCPDGGACVLFGMTANSQSIWLPACLNGCSDDEDCGEGLACAWYDTRQSSTHTVCVPAEGSSPAGGPCTQDGQCRSGRCIGGSAGVNGYCDGGCTDDTDCQDGTVCVDVGYPSAGPDETWGTEDDWQAYPRCRGEVCTSDNDCGDWVCRPDPEVVEGEVEVVHRCMPPIGPGGAGDPCLSCDNGLCIRSPSAPPEDCWDAIDNDGDAKVDCDDVDCRWWCKGEQACGNAADDDGDGFTDCADLDCESFCTTEICGNNLDDDGNGLSDCDDPRCFVECHEMTFCADYGDEDDDGLIDCDDPDCCILDWEDVCRGKRACSEKECGNGLDDDGDGAADCADTNCFNAAGCVEDCENGIDDDGNGLIDCEDVWDCGGTCLETSCADGVDDDFDTLVDCFDSDCALDPACEESLCAGGDCCTNGVDDDGDGRVDCQDGNCASTAACSEAACGGENCCKDGADNDGDADLDCADRDCALHVSCNEGMGFGNGSCSDGLDNDGDRLGDCKDSDCAGIWECLVCYEPCEVDADCPSGICLHTAALEEFPFGGNYRYVGSCQPE